MKLVVNFPARQPVMLLGSSLSTGFLCMAPSSSPSVVHKQNQSQARKECRSIPDFLIFGIQPIDHVANASPTVHAVSGILSPYAIHASFFDPCGFMGRFRGDHNGDFGILGGVRCPEGKGIHDLEKRIPSRLLGEDHG